MYVAVLAGASPWYPTQAASMEATVGQQVLSPEPTAACTTVATWEERLKGPRPVAVRLAITVYSGAKAVANVRVRVT